MRVLIVSWPWRTHFQPMVPLGWAFQAAGHEVRVASSPDLAESLTASGLTAVVAGPGDVLKTMYEQFTEEQVELVRMLEQLGSRDDFFFDFASATKEALTWDRLRLRTRYFTQILQGVNDAMVEELVDYCRWWKPDLVVWEWMSHAGAIVARATGAASARIRSEIDVDAWSRRAFLRLRKEQAPHRREDALADWLGGWAAKFGTSFSEEMVTGHFTIEHMLGSMRLDSDVPHLPLRYVSYHGPAVIAHWARSTPKKPRVLATFGISQKKGREYQAVSVRQLQQILDCLADLDIELVVTAPEKVRRNLSRIPSNAMLTEFVPLHAVVPTCSAVIHHGGIPAFMESIASGVPQLMVGRVVGDIDLRAPLLEAARGGLYIPRPHLCGQRVRECLVRLLEEPAFKEGAQRLRREQATQPAPSELVAELEKLTARYRAR
ncbi:nucleotide disphospho-sugar-binding domain-containing protein [Streptomyces alboniger]|uniref:nucleotide disphospho-sugar-binding domain-containing protein n=1 Tax=Streptomyces alboniger TaxID=132473 RepID=UPI0006E3CC8E|nr:nucleotide disphospho-sugar-binding domain-containing protein [Streptomyces alboniger]